MALTSFDSNVCDALLDLVDGSGPSTRHFKTYGESLYPVFRQGLVVGGKKLTSSVVVTTTSPPKRTTKEQIIYKNTIDKMKEKLTRAISILEKTYTEQSTVVSDYILTNDTVDVRSAGFMYLSWFINEYTVESKVAFSVIVSLQRYIKAVSALVFSHIVDGSESKVSPLMLDDLAFYLDRNIKKYNFRGDTLYEVEPTLIVESTWDKYIPKPPVKPFEHQKLLSDIIMSIGKPFSHGTTQVSPLLAAYVEVRVLTSAGKTTSIVNVAAAAKNRQSVFPDLKVYAVCTIEPIRRRWANLLAYSGISYFSYDEYNDDNKTPDEGDIRKNIRSAVVVICSPEQSLIHLTANPNSILFYDEPTLYSDGTNALKLLNGVAVLKKMPRFTFLCSATLDIPGRELYNDHKAKFPESVFVDVFSPTIYGYSNVRTTDGVVVTPHMCCKTQGELALTISKLETVPLLGKFYNPSVVKQLYDITKKYTTDIPNVDVIFGNVENLSPDSVRKVAYDLLKKIVLLPDSQIQAICRPVKTTDVVNFDKLGTSDANKYQHVNLIATADPVAFAEAKFKELALDIKDEIGSYESMRAPVDEWLKQRDDIKRRAKSDEERAQQLEEHDLSRPKCYIPEKFQINTFEHIRKYGKIAPAGRCRIPFLEILECGHVSDTIDLITQAGVGVYKQSALPRAYTNLLMGTKKQSGLVPDGRLEFVVADTDIAYGIDCPFGGLFVDKSLCEIVSLNTLFQLISRVGRGRKSPYANIFVDRSALDDIMGMIRDEEYENEETATLLLAYKKVSCFFYLKEKSFVLLNIPFKTSYTRFEIKNNETFLYEGDDVKWQGTTGFPHQATFNLTKGMMTSGGKNVGVVLV